MKNSEFRTPLMQSGALLVVIVFVISLMPSGDGMTVGSAIGALLSGVFRLILFLLALAIGLSACIAVLIGIFIAAIALQSREQAATVYADTKTKIALLIQNALTCSKQTSNCCSQTVENISNSESTGPGISQEEYDKMQRTISSLQNANNQLQNDVSALQDKNSSLQNDIQGLTAMVDELKNSEAQIQGLISELSAKIQDDPDAELVKQIAQLEEMVSKTNTEIADIAGRLEFLEEAVTGSDAEPVVSGIFSYLETDEQRSLLTSAVEEGITQDFTYAQFDEFLTEKLPADLDKILKDHPSLTKDYIRSMRK